MNTQTGTQHRFAADTLMVTIGEGFDTTVTQCRVLCGDNVVRAARFRATTATDTVIDVDGTEIRTPHFTASVRVNATTAAGSVRRTIPGHVQVETLHGFTEATDGDPLTVKFCPDMMRVTTELPDSFIYRPPVCVHQPTPQVVVSPATGRRVQQYNGEITWHANERVVIVADHLRPGYGQQQPYTVVRRGNDTVELFPTLRVNATTPGPLRPVVGILTDGSIAVIDGRPMRLRVSLTGQLSFEPV